MQKINISVEIEVGNTTQMQAAQAFLAALSGTNTKTEAVPETTPTEVPGKRKRRTKAEIEADKAAAEAAKAAKAGNAEADNRDNGGDDSEYTIADIRVGIQARSGKHRVAIKDKLVELGAKNVSTIKPEDYATVMEFLESLD